MKHHRIFSLAMTALVVFSGFVTVCAESDLPGFSIHFISELCGDHHCDPDTSSHSCQANGCSHGVCGDNMLVSHCCPVKSFDSIAIPAAVPLCFAATGISLNLRIFIPSRSPGAENPSRTPILRI